MRPVGEERHGQVGIGLFLEPPDGKSSFQGLIPVNLNIAVAGFRIGRTDPKVAIRSWRASRTAASTSRWKASCGTIR